MTEIDQVWLDQIARSVAHWFNARDEKWANIFTESFVAIPVVEFLLNRDWHLLGEISNQTIANDKSIPYQACDIFAKKADEKPLIGLHPVPKTPS